MLVSVCVISYNSALTIIETLDSVLKQTYDLKSIELIISDDHSSDDTEAIVKSWIENNKCNFGSVEYIVSEINNGVTKNCDIAVRHSSGDWIKLIAGDDILHPDCIKNNIIYINENSEAEIIFSIQEKFGDNISPSDNNKYLPNSYDKQFFSLGAEKQLSWLTIESLTNTPTSFINKSAIESVGFFDTEFKYVEDYPLWLRLSKSGVRFFYFDKVTVFYRISDSVSRPNEKIINLKYFSDVYCFEKKNIFHLIKPKYKRQMKMLWYSIVLKLVNMFGNRRNSYSMFLYKCVLLIKPGILKRKLFGKKWSI